MHRDYKPDNIAQLVFQANYNPWLKKFLSNIPSMGYDYDRRQANAGSLADKAEKATAMALHGKSAHLHLEAGKAHWAAAKAFEGEGNRQESQHHRQLANEHRKDMLDAIESEVEAKWAKHHHQDTHRPGLMMDADLKAKMVAETDKTKREYLHLLGF